MSDAPWLRITPVRDAAGRDCLALGVFEEVPEAQAALARFQQLLAREDIGGEHYFSRIQERAQIDLTAAHAENQSLCVLLLAVERFRTVTEALGQAGGEAVLVELAERLQQAALERGWVARLPGRGYVMLLPRTGLDAAVVLANQMLGVVRQPMPLLGDGDSLSASVGIAMFPDHGHHFAQLFKAAELALQFAQTQGPDTSFVFSPAMQEQLLHRERLRTALQGALELDQLHLHYEPMVDMQTGLWCGLAASWRWQHPELGTTLEAGIHALTQDAALVASLSDWLIHRVCSDLRGWRAQGVTVPRVSFSLSPLQLRNGSALAQIKAALAENALEPACLQVGIKEASLMDNTPDGVAALAMMREFGIGLALDDFGSAHSSLSDLKRFPLNAVRLGEPLLREVVNSDTDVALVAAVIAIAHGLGMQVVAEGVESTRQCELLRSSLADVIQGPLYSSPLLADQVPAFAAEDRHLPPHLLRVRKPQRTLLLVDDEPNIVSALKRMFRRDGHRILTATSGQEGLQVLAENAVDVIISDQRMPGMTGVEFLRAAKANYPDTVRIVLSGYTELQSVTDAINEGAVYRFLTKPWEEDQLREHINKAFEYKELVERNEQLQLQILTSNQELASANRQLEAVLGQARSQIQRDETSLAVIREALQYIPTPVIGVDRESMIVFVNPAAEALWMDQRALLGCDLQQSVPELEGALACGPGEQRLAWIDSRPYQVTWNYMGAESQSSGRIITLHRETQLS